MKNGTAKVHCLCSHEYQDKEHGKGVRVANTTTKAPSTNTQEVRCTVCKKTHTVDSSRIR